MDLDFLREVLLDLGLPPGQIRGSDRLSAIDADAQGQGMLMLARERDQTFITQHIGSFRKSTTHHRVAVFQF
jgi:hypothetical protein